jgi:hypothetical protein
MAFYLAFQPPIHPISRAAEKDYVVSLATNILSQNTKNDDKDS